jgi:hypothetical protein
VQRFQREYALAVIDGQLFWLEESGFPNSNPPSTAGDLSPSMYLTRPYAPLATRMAPSSATRSAAGGDRADPGQPAPNLPLSYIELGVNTFGGYASFFRDEVPRSSRGDGRGAAGALKASNAAAIAAAQDDGRLVQAQKPQATRISRSAPSASRACCTRPSASTCRSRN